MSVKAGVRGIASNFEEHQEIGLALSIANASEDSGISCEGCRELRVGREVGVVLSRFGVVGYELDRCNGFSVMGLKVRYIVVIHELGTDDFFSRFLIVSYISSVIDSTIVTLMHGCYSHVAFCFW